MANISFLVNLKSVDKLQKDILNEIARVMGAAISKARDPIISGISDLVVNAFRQDGTYGAILNGELKDYFLLKSSDIALTNMLDVITNSIKVKQRAIKQVGGLSLSGGLDINIFDDSLYIDILGAQSASYTTSNNFYIPWFEWILGNGSSPVYIGAELVDTAQGVLLAQNPNKNIAVPPQHAGTSGDNFITKTLLGLEDEVNELVIREVEKRI